MMDVLENDLQVQSTSQVPVNQPSHQGQLATVSNETPSQTEIAEKRSLVQKQLVLLLHANQCKAGDSQATDDVEQCSIRQCKTMKDVLRHMPTCSAGRTCNAPHCLSSKQIISHWNHCIRSNCAVCLPIKQQIKIINQTRKNIAANATQNVGTNVASNSTSSLQSAADMKKAYDILGIHCPTAIGAVDIVPGLNSNATSNLNQVEAPNVVLDLSNNNKVAAKQSTLQSQAGLVNNSIQQQSVVTSNAPASSIIPPSLNQNADSTNAATSAAESRTLSMQIPCDSNTPTGPVVATTQHTVKEWHQLITNDHRNHLVIKLARSIFPINSLTSIDNCTILNLVSYSRKVEGIIYEAANSKTEYYRMLAEKYIKIQKGLDERRKRRKRLQQLQELQQEQQAKLQQQQSQLQQQQLQQQESGMRLSSSNALPTKPVNSHSLLSAPGVNSNGLTVPNTNQLPFPNTSSPNSQLQQPLKPLRRPSPDNANSNTTPVTSPNPAFSMSNSNGSNSSISSGPFFNYRKRPRLSGDSLSQTSPVLTVPQFPLPSPQQTMQQTIVNILQPLCVCIVTYALLLLIISYILLLIGVNLYLIIHRIRWL